MTRVRISMKYSLSLRLTSAFVREVNYIIMADEKSSGLIKGVSFGTIPPGGSQAKTLYLLSTGTAGERAMDISVQSKVASSSASDDSDEEALLDTRETLQTLTVMVASPLQCGFDTLYSRNSDVPLSLLDLDSFASNDLTPRGNATVTATLTCGMSWKLSLESIRLSAEVCTRYHSCLIHLTCHGRNLTPLNLSTRRLTPKVDSPSVCHLHRVSPVLN